MSPSEMITIRVPYWEKYNDKSKEHANPIWLRISNTLPFDETLHGLTTQAKWLYLTLLCCCSRQNEQVIKVNAQWLCKALSTNVQALSSCSLALSSRQLIEIIEGDFAYINKQINKQNKQTNKACAFDLESVYREYPRKIGKARGMERLQKEITCEQQYGELKLAMQRFVEFHKQQRTEDKYIPYFSTWVSQWRDWVDPDTGRGPGNGPGGSTPTAADYLRMIRGGTS